MNGRARGVQFTKGPLFTTPWTNVIFDDLFRCWYRQGPGGRIDFRVEGLLLDTSIFDLIGILGETELAKDWMPYYTVPFRVGLKSAKLLGRFGRFSKVSQYLVDLPSPLPNVEAIVHAQICDDLERNKKFVLLLKSFAEYADQSEKEVWPWQPHAPLNKYKRVELGGGGTFQQIKNDADMRTLFCIHLPFRDSPISTTMINFVSSIFMKRAFGMFHKAIKNNRPMFEQKRKEDQWFYGFLGNRIGELDAAGFDALGQAPKMVQKRWGFTSTRMESLNHNAVGNAARRSKSRCNDIPR